MLEYQDIRALAAELGCPADDLIALSKSTDPFYAGVGRRREAAEWFARIWEQMSFGHGIHVRRIHYRISVDAAEPALKPDGEVYQNTHKDWKYLLSGALAARYLDLVPSDRFVDRRNEILIVNADFKPDVAPKIEVDDGEDLDLCLPDELSPPDLRLRDFLAQQRYLIEVWVEKSTINDILEPVAKRYGCNLIVGKGEESKTRCDDAVTRALNAGRPMRILYISDFDPGGMSMPVAVARKIEFILRNGDHDLDITLQPIALLPEQVEQYKLPRIPLKETERRAGRFEERFGEGGVELDALEALHPGQLERIVTEAVLEYYDTSLKTRQYRAERDINRRLKEIEAEVYENYDLELGPIEVEYGELRQRLMDLQDRASGVWRSIKEELAAQAPYISRDDVPEVGEAERGAPLFDSTRDYLTQLGFYKAHQRKEGGS